MSGQLISTSMTSGKGGRKWERQGRPHLISSIVLSHFLAYNEHLWVSLQLLLQCLVKGVANGDAGLPWRAGGKTSRRLYVVEKTSGSVAYARTRRKPLLRSLLLTCTTRGYAPFTADSLSIEQLPLLPCHVHIK